MSSNFSNSDVKPHPLHQHNYHFYELSTQILLSPVVNAYAMAAPGVSVISVFAAIRAATSGMVWAVPASDIGQSNTQHRIYPG